MDGSVYDDIYERIVGKDLVMEVVCRFSFCFVS